MSKKKNKSISISKQLFSSKGDKLQLLSSLKQLSFSEFQKEVKKAYSHPMTKHFILGTAKPKSIFDLRKSRQSYYSDNLEGEIAWILESIKMYTPELNRFIIYEEELQKYILEGSLDKARKKLDNINQDICYSYWGLEVEFFLTEKISGTEENWKLNNSIGKEAKNVLTLFFSQIFSKKAEKGLSIREFHRSFQNEIRGISEPEYEYLNFKLAYHLLWGYPNLAFYAYVDSISSIIDRYQSFILILNELISSSDPIKIALAKQSIESLNGSIKDCRIDRFTELLGLKKLTKGDHQIFEIIEKYSTGEFEYCIEIIPTILKYNPGIVELWDMYAKSLLESRKDFIPLEGSTFLNSIIKDIFHIYDRKGDSQERAEELLKTVASLPFFKFSKQLFSILSNSLGIGSKENVINRYYCTNSAFSNPLSYLYSFTVNETVEFGELLTSKCVKFISNQSDNYDEIKDKIPEIKARLYKLRREFKIANFSTCVTLGEKFDINKIKNNLYSEEVINILYQSLVETNSHDKAIELYVNTYFENKNLISLIITNPLIDKIISQDYSMSGKLENAIFFTLANLENYYQFVAIEMWLEEFELEYPSKIDLSKFNDSKEKIFFILYEGCVIDVLEKFYYNYETREDVIAERKKILSILIQNDEEQKEKYINELSSITQKEKVQLLIQEVNRGRIRISPEMLTSDNNESFEKSFKRYHLVSEFSKHNDASGFDSKKLLKNFLENLLYPDSQSVDPSFLSFKSLANELIDSFLFNKKSGLDGDLSTRFRHGEIENQLRSVFDAKNLISKKDDQGSYVDLQYWNQRYAIILDTTILSKIQKALKEFSRKTDNLIQFLVKEQLQVRSENYPGKEHALFNYYFIDSYLKFIHEDTLHFHDHFDQFLDYIFSVLKTMTEKNLEDVVHFLSNDLSTLIDRELEILKTEIELVCENNEVIELSQNIIDAKVDFQNELLSICNWFVISDSTIDKSMDANSLIHCSFESSNIQHPNMVLLPIIEASENLYLFNYTHYIFIFLNLIDNIRTHSKLSHDKIEVSVKSFYRNGKLFLKVKNNFNVDKVNVESLQKTLEIKKLNWRDEVDFEKVNKEGGTGFEKIKKILVYDIQSKDHRFDYVLEQNTLEIVFEINITHQFEIDG